MTAAEALALAEIHGYAAANRVRFTRHAWLRMSERRVAAADVVFCLKTAGTCGAQANGTWKVPGQDTAGDDLTVVVAIEDGALVVTTY
jgi:hypothetical protein